MKGATIPPMANPSNKLTAEQWAAREEDADGELVDGALVEEEMAGYGHETVVAWLIATLHAWAKQHGARVGGSDAMFGIRRDRGRKPDVTVYLSDARLPPRRGLIRVPPSIAIEVVTPTPRAQRRDRVEKIADDAEIGVRWYRLVDPELRSFQVLELGPDGRYAYAVGAVDGAVTVPGCDGLVLDLDDLWRELDSLPEGTE